MDPNIWTISKDRKFFFGTMRTEQPELLLSNDSDSNELLFVAAFNTMHFIAFVNRFSAQLHLITVFKRVPLKVKRLDLGKTVVVAQLVEWSPLTSEVCS